MSKILEDIFAHAVALDSNTRLKNEIHCREKHVYVINYDRTVMLRFDSPKTFKEPVSFYANDYDSPHFRREGDRIVFERKSAKGAFSRKRTCRMPDMEVVDLFDRFCNPEDKMPPLVADVSDEVLTELDKDLGHIEFVPNGTSPRFIQKDLFSTSSIEVDPVKTGGLNLFEDDVESTEFDPIAVRTNDFFALFTFCSRIKWYLNPKGYFIVTGNAFGLVGIVAGCIYDEVGKIKLFDEGGIEDENGREKPQGRVGVQITCGETDARTGAEKVRRGRFLRSV